MSLIDKENPVFINASGFIDEFGELELLPLFESTERPNLAAYEKQIEACAYTARLYDKADTFIERSLLSQDPVACGPENKTDIAHQVFWVSLPKIKGANRIEFLKDGQPVAEVSLGKAPDISDVTAKVQRDKIDVSWSSRSRAAIAFSVSLVLTSGKRITLGTVEGENRLSAELRGLPRGGRASVEVAASNGILVSKAASRRIRLEPSAPLALILSPRDGQTYHFREAISAMGNCYDAVGDRLPWAANGIHWKVDNKVLENETPALALHNLEPGKHRISIASKKWGVLSSAAFKVNTPSASHHEYEELLSRLRKDQELKLLP